MRLIFNLCSYRLTFELSHMRPQTVARRLGQGLGGILAVALRRNDSQATPLTLRLGNAQRKRGGSSTSCGPSEWRLRAPLPAPHSRFQPSVKMEEELIRSTTWAPLLGTHPIRLRTGGPP